MEKENETAIETGGREGIGKEKGTEGGGRRVSSASQGQKRRWIRNRKPLEHITIVTQRERTKIEKRDMCREAAQLAARKVMRKRCKRYYDRWHYALAEARMCRYADVWRRWKMCRIGLRKMRERSLQSRTMKRLTSIAHAFRHRHLRNICFGAMRNFAKESARKRKLARYSRAFYQQRSKRRALRRIHHRTHRLGSARFAGLICSKLRRKRIFLQWCESAILAQMSSRAARAMQAFRMRMALRKFSSNLFRGRLRRFLETIQRRIKRHWLGKWIRVRADRVSTRCALAFHRAKTYKKCLRQWHQFSRAKRLYEISRAVDDRMLLLDATRAWVIFTEDARMTDRAVRMHNISCARRAFRHLASNVVRQMKVYAVDLFCAEKRCMQAWKRWIEFAKEARCNRRADMFRRYVAGTRCLRLWSRSAKKKVSLREASYVVGRRTELFSITERFVRWRWITQRRQILRFGFLRLRYGYCGAILLNRAATASRKAYRIDRMTAMVDIFSRHHLDVCAVAVGKWTEFVDERRRDRRRLLTKMFWLWDEVVVQRRVDMRLEEISAEHARTLCVRNALSQWRRGAKRSRAARLAAAFGGEGKKSGVAESKRGIYHTSAAASALSPIPEGGMYMPSGARFGVMRTY